MVEPGKTGLVHEKVMMYMNYVDTKRSLLWFYPKQAGTITINLVGQPKEQTTSQNAPQEHLRKKEIIKTFIFVVKESTQIFKDYLVQRMKAHQMLVDGQWGDKQEAWYKLQAVLGSDKAVGKKGVTDIELTQSIANLIAAMAEFEKA